MKSMNARQYNEQTMKGLFRKIYPVIAEQVLTRTGIRRGRCLDIGGGPGMLGIRIAQASELEVVIVDPLEACLDLAWENIDEQDVSAQVSTQQAKAEQLPFADNSIDLAVSRGSIFFWENQAQGLAEIYRVLRPGGWSFVGGGFGNKALRDEIFAAKANDEKWNQGRESRMRNNPPEHFRALLAELAIDGVVETGDEGNWILFQKPEPVT